MDRIAHWEGFSSYVALGKGEDPVYTYIDRTAWHKAGGKRSMKPLEAYTKSVRIRYTPLPSMEKMTPDQRQAHIRRRCRELEKAFREKRNGPALSKSKMDKLDHRARPKGRPVRTPKPKCHAASREAAQAFLESFREFLNAYKIASAVYRSGCLDVEFPSGSFKPPLIEAAA